MSEQDPTAAVSETNEVAPSSTATPPPTSEPGEPDGTPDLVENFVYKVGKKLPRYSAHHWSPYQRIDSIFVVISAGFTCWIAWLLLKEGFSISLSRLLYLVVFWIVLTYLALPRLHQILSLLYVPDYYIGRSRTADGILGDPINLAFNGSDQDVHQAMQAAGWTQADEITLSSSLKIIYGALFKKSYPSAPVSPLYLFGHSQAFAYQKEVDGDPSKRHHIRFWPTPKGWVLPGGRQVDWLAAATFDRAVGLSLFTLQVTHKIDANIDIERDHVVHTIKEACPQAHFDLIKDASTAYHARNGGGDKIMTDGHMPVIGVEELVDEELTHHTDAAFSHGAVLRSSREKEEAHLASTGHRRVRDRHLPPPAVLGTILLVGIQILEITIIGALMILQPQQWQLQEVTIYASQQAGAYFIGWGILMTVLLVGTIMRKKWLRLGLLVVMTLAVVAHILETLSTPNIEHTALWLSSTTLSVLTILSLTSPTVREWVGAHD